MTKAQVALRDRRCRNSIASDPRTGRTLGVTIVLMTGPALAGPPEQPQPVVGLLAAAARGDSDAFGEFYDSVAPIVWGLVRHLSPDEATAERVLHELFLDAWRRAPSIVATGADAEAWLCERARQTCLRTA